MTEKKRGRKPTFPELNVLAYKLETTNFINELTDEEKDLVHASGRMEREKYQNISILPWARGGPLWSVRASCMGVTVWVGMAHALGDPDQHRAKLFRYADMSRLKFWKHRMRLRRPPRAGELNISLARAEQDMKNEPHMMNLLNEVEAFMLQNGIIKPAEEVIAATKELREARAQSTRLSLREMNTKLEEMHAKLDSLQKDMQFILRNSCCTSATPGVVYGVASS